MHNVPIIKYQWPRCWSVYKCIYTYINLNIKNTYKNICQYSNNNNNNSLRWYIHNIMWNVYEFTNAT